LSSSVRPGAADIEAIERATFDAVPPEALASEGAWLLGLDHGTVGRAHSAVPLSHDTADVADASVVGRIEALYSREGLPAVFRVPALPTFDPVRAELSSRGYVACRPTCTFIGTVAGIKALSDTYDDKDRATDTTTYSVEVIAQPDDEWRAVFLGGGFDPVDGASRVQILGRARHAAFACVRVNGLTVAAGMGSFSHGWASIHGMRTLASHRGQGMASGIIDLLAREAEARGMQRAFLQVDANNPAQALYRRAGFEWAWDYAYWARQA
jgi:ribosomal protein S18 acetylase RimI-like enzyme